MVIVAAQERRAFASLEVLGVAVAGAVARCHCRGCSGGVRYGAARRDFDSWRFWYLQIVRRSSKGDRFGGADDGGVVMVVVVEGWVVVRYLVIPREPRNSRLREWRRMQSRSYRMWAQQAAGRAI